MHTMNTHVKKLVRPTGDRKIAGVCAGLGEYFEIDAVIFRLCFLFSVFFGGLGVLVYLIMWILLPAQQGTPGQSSANVHLHLSNSDRMISGVCGGLGESARLDPVLFRVAFVVLAFLCGFGILIYIALWMLLPRAAATPSAPAAPSAPDDGVTG